MLYPEIPVNDGSMGLAADFSTASSVTVSIEDRRRWRRNSVQIRRNRRATIPVTIPTMMPIFGALRLDVVVSPEGPGMVVLVDMAMLVDIVVLIDGTAAAV